MSNYALLTKLLKDEIDGIFVNPSTSFWLKDAIQTSLDRDCVDAAKDAKELARITAKVAALFV